MLLVACVIAAHDDNLTAADFNCEPAAPASCSTPIGVHAAGAFALRKLNAAVLSAALFSAARPPVQELQGDAPLLQLRGIVGHRASHELHWRSGVRGG